MYVHDPLSESPLIRSQHNVPGSWNANNPLLHTPPAPSRSHPTHSRVSAVATCDARGQPWVSVSSSDPSCIKTMPQCIETSILKV